MSALPFLLALNDELEQLSNQRRAPFYDDYDFGLGGYSLQPQRRRCSPLIALRLGQPEQQLQRRGEQSGALSVGKDGFQVCMDVQQFKPSELNVKVVDNSVVVEGKHEEREDEHGFITRHFMRRYVLPNGYDPNQVVSTLSSDGVLTVKVPLPKQEESNERIIQIQQTGPAHLNVKENEKKGAGDASQQNGDKKA